MRTYKVQLDKYCVIPGTTSNDWRISGTGVIYCTTDTPQLIYDKFGPGVVISIEDIGIGYFLN